MESGVREPREWTKQDYKKLYDYLMKDTGDQYEPITRYLPKDTIVPYRKDKEQHK